MLSLQKEEKQIRYNRKTPFINIQILDYNELSVNNLVTERDNK